MIEDAFVLKTACLLHDPPNKAWLLVSREDHEEEARRIARRVLEGTCLEAAAEGMERKAKPADVLASSIDRWLLSKLVGEEYSLFRVDRIKLKNIFNPKFSQEIDRRRPPTDEFVKTLNDVLKPIKDPRLAYHVLYASYEATWVQLGLPAGPADTRSPSHTVFDHNYATASIMNWLLGGREPEGILLYIDLGGVQRFVSSSRKLSDLWLSSYLSSALAWSLFWDFIRVLGPDVMVIPTCRRNPFYYHSLISELIKNNVDRSVIEKIKRISRDFTGYDPEKDKVPRYAVVPVTATFILPSLDRLREFDEFKEINVESGLKGLEEFVKKRYREIWRDVYNEIVEKCKDLMDELGDLAVKVEELLNKCREFGFDATPPLPIRVIALRTNELRKLGLKDEERYKLYHYMFKLLSYEERRRKLYKYRPEEDLKLFDMTSQPIETWPKKTDRGFEYCSVCGYLPAIIVLPTREDEYVKFLKIELEPIFSLGERLCPYCLIKRLMGASNYVLKFVLDKLLGEIEKELPKFRFPSVSDIALIPFKKSFITNAMKLDGTDLANELSEWIREIWNKIVKKRVIPTGREPITRTEGELAKKIKKLKSENLKNDLEEILFMDSEEAFLKTQRIKEDGGEKYYNPRKDWLELRKRIYEHEKMFSLMNLREEGIEELNAYYAIIRCDADNLGKIIRGRVKEGFGISLRDYFCNVLEGPAKKVVEAILSNDFEKAAEIYRKHGIKDFDAKLKDEISTFIFTLEDRGEIIISPSYHSALSNALMANAVRDKEIIDENDGITIYAGGDDLLALTPIKNSISTVQKLREKFSFPSKYEGFDVIGNYLIPSLATASRSFSVYFAHYMFPLYTAIGRSAELLEDVAKRAKWIGGREEKRKDSLILSYSPKGSERFSLLPLSDVKGSDRVLGKSLKYIDELVSQIKRGEFSTSLVYDLYNDQTIKSLIDVKSETLLKKLVEKIFERNCEVRDEQKCKKMVEIWVKKLVEDYDLVFEIGDDVQAQPFLEQFFLALILYRSGLRGWSD